MSARDDILGRVRARLGRNAENGEVYRKEIDRLLATPSTGPQPVVDAAPEQVLARFIERSLAMASTVDQVADQAAVAPAVARYLAELKIPAKVAVAPGLTSIDWQAAGIAAEVRGAREGDAVGVTGCFCAVAETGTLMLCSAPTAPATLSLLPETHIAVVDARRIVPHMEDAWALARREFGTLPRAVNFVSGPSRTADIEQTIVLGAHGPYRVHLVVVGG